MKPNVAEVETHSGSVREKGKTAGISDVPGAGPIRSRGRKLNSGLPRNWVKPWLTMSNSDVDTCQCDGDELSKIQEFI